MEKGDIKRLVEDLAAAIVLGEPGNPTDLEDLGRRLGEIRQLAEHLDSATVHSIVSRAEQILSDLGAVGADEAEGLVEELGHAVTALQSILRDGRDEEEVSGWLNDCLSSSLPSSDDPAPRSEQPEAPAARGSSDAPARTPFDWDVEICEDFVDEAREHLDSVEGHMLRLEKDPREIEAVNALFRAFHTIKGVSVHLDLIEISTLAHEAENLLDQIREGERKWDVQSVEAVFQAADGMRRLFEKLSSAVASGTCVESDPHLPELLSLIRSLSEADGDEASREEGEEGATAPPTGAAAAKRSPAGSPESRRVKKVREFVRVDAERLDHLVESVGELVTAVSVMEQSLISGVGDSLESSQREVKKIARELQELGTSLRMVPLRSTFQKMTRLVRDLARQAGKSVDMQVSGEDTELDKTMVEKLGDPLLHLLRNAVDHGIESSAGERGLLGKPERGTIELRAYHQGGNICIEVEDDGRGLRRERILEKARKAGLVAEGEDPGDNDLYKLVFEAGFSTAETVTSLSGRGVGLDVVRRNIEDLRGSISLSSEPGFGTLFTISLPLTIAIIDGMVVRVGEERYIVPTLSVVRSVRPEENDLTAVLDREQVINVQDALIPFCRLSDLFEIDGAVHDPTDGLVLIVHHLGKQYGFLVDEILGQQQVVIKNLGKGIRSVQGIGGGAVMADGKIGLILDVAGLVELARTSGRQALRCAV